MSWLKKGNMGPAVVKFDTIAVATDLTCYPSTTLRYAAAIARLYKSTLVLVDVIDPGAYAFPDGMPLYLQASQAARDELRKIEEDARDRGNPVHFVRGRRIACERILEMVKRHNADLLILGTRAKTVAGRAALGTVARQLLVSAPCPIMTVSPDAEEFLPWAGAWRRVLAATDFSDASTAALRCAHRIAVRELIALHVSNSQNERECEGCRKKLRLLAPLEEPRMVPVEYIVLSGDAGELIAKQAMRFAVDLVVLGTPADEPIGEDWHESTVLRVISEARCPVLCVPFKARSDSVEQKFGP